MKTMNPPMTTSNPMSATKHTPGPWHNEDGFVFAANSLRVADCNCDGQEDEMPDAELEANAAMIAACPSMHAALVFCSKYFAMQAQKGIEVPSQLVKAVKDALPSLQSPPPKRLRYENSQTPKTPRS